jgi:disulfide bond formation protein DsbB
MTRPTLILLATLGSALMLGGAFAFQVIGGLAPCHLCLLQRWPHAAAVLIGLLALALARSSAGVQRLLAFLGALAALTTAALGLYHTGVERAWWQGPDTCTSGDIGSVSADQLLDQILAAPIVRCDEVAWAMGGLSMASWNMLASLALALIWLLAARRT